MDFRDWMPWNWPKSGAFADAGDPLRALQADINRAFEGFRASMPAPTFHANWGMALQSLEPKIDVFETEAEIEITAELPGLEEADIEVGLNEDSVTIKGVKRPAQEAAGRTCRVSERTFGLIQRSVPLPGAVDQDDVRAVFRNGVLTVLLRRIGEAESPLRRIAIVKG